jgi:ubiquinone/menaquinone biosynthesis C-methylase UbiE
VSDHDDFDEDDDFDKEMHGADWAAVYERQAERADLVSRLCDLLGLAAGDHVLEIGSGPGHTSVQLAARVEPGTVYAVDRQPDALAYLLTEAEGDTERIRPIVGDAESLPVCFDRPTPTLVAFVLHHVDDPARALESIASSVPESSPLLVVEYHPEAAGEVGPPIDHRLAPAKLREWLAAAGFTVESADDLGDEKYGLLARR